MIIVISHTGFFEGEADLVNQFFDEGLQLFHLRKYGHSESEIRDFIQSVKPLYRQRIVLHHTHGLADDFGIQRLHFPAAEREKLTAQTIAGLRHSGKRLSTSVHAVAEYNQLPVGFEYAFLSPVFDSISKTDYKAKPFDWSEYRRSNIRLIALGGVHPGNCLTALEMGFDGVALLGSVWQSNDAINVYKETALQCSTTVR